MVEGCVTSGLIPSVVAKKPIVMLALRRDFIGLCINNLFGESKDWVSIVGSGAYPAKPSKVLIRYILL